MKIGFVCPDDLSINNFAKSFIDRFKKTPSNDLVTICRKVKNYLDDIQGSNIRHINVNVERFINPGKDLLFIFSLWEICRKEKFEIVFNWTTKPNIYGPIAQKLAGIPYIVIAIRGLGGTFLPQKTMKGRVLKKITTLLYRIACRTSNKIWFTNKGDLEYFISQGIVEHHKCILTKNAINISNFSPQAVNVDLAEQLRQEFQIGPDDMIVVMVARLIWSKGVREFVDASIILKKKGYPVKFILVAPQEDKQTDAIPLEYIRSNEKDGSFLWVGFRKEVREIYSLAQVCVLPSYYQEGGYPRALLEPMALGKPVITTDLPQCRGPVDVGKNGFLIPAKNGRALAEKIELIIQHESMKDSMGKHSRKIIEDEFDEEKIVDILCSEIGIPSG